VRVFSLGKEKFQGRPLEIWKRAQYIAKFYSVIWGERKNYDAVFVHMNPEYVVLGGWLWRLMGKRVSLWYAHGHVPFMLRVAEKFIDVAFTSTQSGFRLPSKKLRVIGQGIDVDAFTFQERVWNATEPLRLLIVGRISPVKDYETLLRAGKRLTESGKNIHIDIVGGAGLPEQEKYLASLKDLAEKLGITSQVTFHGAVANTEIGGYLARANCFVNTSRTGSLDKAMVEAMATGLPTLSSNIAMREVFGSLADELMFSEGDDGVLAEKIGEVIAKSDNERNSLGKELRTIVEEKHSLLSFVKKIIVELQKERT